MENIYATFYKDILNTKLVYSMNSHFQDTGQLLEYLLGEINSLLDRISLIQLVKM